LALYVLLILHVLVYKYELCCKYILLYKYANMNCNMLEKVQKLNFRILLPAHINALLPAHIARASAGSSTAGAVARAPVEQALCRRSTAGAPAVDELPPAHRLVRRQ
jgi:hypothetical protein